jgi:hypothetical protein
MFRTHRPTGRLPRRALVLVGATVALAAAVPTPAQAANSCRTAAGAPGNKVVVASKGAIVFSSRKLKQHVACTYKFKRQVKLGRIVCCSVERYRLGGRYLGYAIRLDEAFNEVDELGGIDLKTGRQIKYGTKPRIDTGGYVNGFYITPTGSLAWLQYDLTEDGRREAFTVRAAARGGAIDDLDSGNIALGSLGLSSAGKTLYWTKDGAVQTATLR